MATKSPSAAIQTSNHHAGGVVAMETHNPVEEAKEVETKNPVSTPVMTVAATTDNASLELQQLQNQQLVAPAEKSSSPLNNTTGSISGGEKDEKLIITTMTTTFQINYNMAIRVKKAKAKRPSLHAFYKQAAIAAAARLERRPSSTRHGGRRENTNIVTSTTGALIKSTQKKPRFSSSVKSRDDDGSSGSRSISSSNSRKQRAAAAGKRKSNRTDPKGSPSAKKHKKAAPPAAIDTSTNNPVSNGRTPFPLDNPEATTRPNTHDTPSSSNRQRAKSRIKNTPVSVVVASAAVAARLAGMTTREEFVELPYRPDSAAQKDFPTIPLPRAIDVVLGRGSRVAKHHGNMLFRGIVRNHKKRYCSPETKKSDKNIIAQEVVEMVVQSGGRFLELAEEYDGASVLTGPWRHASYAKCVEKTCQALREQKWHYTEPSPTNASPSMIPVEDPESIPPPSPNVSPNSPARSSSPARAKEPAPTRSSRSLADSAKTDTAGSPTSNAAHASHQDKSSSASSPSNPNTTPQQERGQGSLVAVRAKTDTATSLPAASRQDKSSVAPSPSKNNTTLQRDGDGSLANAVVDNESRRTVEEQMSRLQDGSRIAIYWPLDAAYYEGTVEDRLQDNFFYVRYDDGESEWLDLNKHGFKVLTTKAPVAAVARAATKVVAKQKNKNKSCRDKKETSNKGETGLDKKESSRGKKKIIDEKESSNKKEANVTKPAAGRGGSSKTAVKVPGAKKPLVIRSSAQRSKQILDSIAKHGLGDWELVASEVPDWTAEDCRRRYELYLDPTLSKEPFTENELREIMLLQAEHGNDWAAIAPNLTIPRSCVLLSDKWNRKIRNIILPRLLNLGLARKQIDGNDKKQINYHGHFEEVLAEVAATKL